MAIDDKQLIALLTNFKDEIVQALDHRMGIVQEDFQHKLDLVVEGQQLLVERLEEARSELKAEIVKGGPAGDRDGCRSCLPPPRHRGASEGVEGARR